MFKLKKLLSVALSLVMIVSLSVPAFAVDSNTVSYNSYNNIKLSKDITVNVNIPKEYQSQVTQEDLKTFFDNDESIRDGDEITIIEIEDYNETIQHNNPQSYRDYYETYLKDYTNEYELTSFFVISAAQGETVTLKKRYEKTVSTSINSGNPFIKGDIGGSATKVIEITHEFKGPEDGSIYNSREFRVKFLAQDATWLQYKYNSAGTLLEKRTGTCTIPTKGISYSLLHKID